MTDQPTGHADELLAGPGDETPRRGLPSRAAALLAVAAVGAVVGWGPGLLSGEPTGEAPRTPPSPAVSADGRADRAPVGGWTEGALQPPGGNSFVQSSARLLRLPAT